MCINKSLAVDEVTFLNIHCKGQTIGDVTFIRSKGKYAMMDVGEPKAEVKKVKKKKIFHYLKKSVSITLKNTLPIMK